MVRYRCISKGIIQKLIKSKYIKILFNLANNYEIESNELLTLVRVDNPPKERNINFLISIHPNANEEVLCKLARYCSLSNTALYILFHRNCTLKVIEIIFSRTVKTNKALRYCGLKHLAKFFSCSTSASVLESHSNSLFWQDRYAIATNPNMPQKTKNVLSKDSNIVVRNAVSNPIKIS